MKALVGYTGFVGSNLCAAGDFDGLFNSKNIEEAYGTSPDLLVYAGVRAEKYLANNDPEKDMAQILQAQENIKRIAPRKLVLISTIDVFQDPSGADETTPVRTKGLHAYGLDRYRLEQWTRENYPDALIIRLPGLYGKNIKKNFIYDFINVIPFMLKAAKFEELCARDPELREYYSLQENGFYKAEIPPEKRKTVRKKFEDLGFTALNFTDSRSTYQFYDLAWLWDDIRTLLGSDVLLFHPATEPVSAGELYCCLTGNEFVNELGGVPARYDYRTVHAGLFGRTGGYIKSKAEVMEDIKKFTETIRGEAG